MIDLGGATNFFFNFGKKRISSVGMCGCVQVCADVHGCAWGCADVHGYVWDEFSEYLLET